MQNSKLRGRFWVRSLWVVSGRYKSDKNNMNNGNNEEPKLIIPIIHITPIIPIIPINLIGPIGLYRPGYKNVTRAAKEGE